MKPNQPRPYEGSEAVKNGRLQGATRKGSNYFDFFCPNCPDRRCMRILNYENQNSAARGFMYVFRLYCETCKLEDFVKITSRVAVGDVVDKPSPPSPPQPLWSSGSKNGRLQGATGKESDHFDFFCPNCPDRRPVRILDHAILTHGIINCRVYIFRLYCENCKLQDFVTIDASGVVRVGDIVSDMVDD